MSAKKILAVILAGGKGSRMNHITGGILPKSLIRLSKVHPLPFISYQLQVLQKSGIKDVLLVFEQVWQIETFKQSIKVQEVPDLRYSFALFSWKKCAFEFIQKNYLLLENKTVFWSYGDFFYSRKLLEEMLYKNRQSKNTVCIKVTSASPSYEIPARNKKFFKIEDDTIIGISESFNKQGDFVLSAPYIFSTESITQLRKKRSSTFEFVESLIKKEPISFIENTDCINMNSEKHIKRITSRIKKWIQ